MRSNQLLSTAPAECIKEDKYLVARIQAGENAAFERSVRLYGPRMMAVAFRLLRHEQDAQDAVQDAFLSAFKSIDRFQGASRLSTWLHRIVVNACLMKLRTKRRKPEQALEDLLPRFHNDGPRGNQREQLTVTCDTTVLDRELCRVVRTNIGELSDPYRIVLMLRDIEQFTTAETASILSLTENAVKMRLHRARKALGTLMESRVNGSVLQQVPNIHF